MKQGDVVVVLKDFDGARAGDLGVVDQECKLFVGHYDVRLIGKKDSHGKSKLVFLREDQMKKSGNIFGN